ILSTILSKFGFDLLSKGVDVAKDKIFSLLGIDEKSSEEEIIAKITHENILKLRELENEAQQIDLESQKTSVAWFEKISPFMDTLMKFTFPFIASAYGLIFFVNISAFIYSVLYLKEMKDIPKIDIPYEFHLWNIVFVTLVMSGKSLPKVLESLLKIKK
ncbi:MAG: hypothetical protein ACRC0V_09400, partial [Fusobacteriaceae bacterium]